MRADNADDGCLAVHLDSEDLPVINAAPDELAQGGGGSRRDPRWMAGESYSRVTEPG
jgi:hypothetical protein